MKTNVWALTVIVFLAVSCITTLTGEGFASDRFEILDDGTVKDHTSGLMWAATDNGSNINWSGSIEYCEAYSGGGHNDWRTPTTNELATLYGNSKKVDGKDYAQSIDLVTSTIRVTGPWVWTSRRTSKNKAFAYGFNYGAERRLHRGSGGGRRALPVRSLP